MLRVGERAKVVRLERPTDEDRSARQDQEGLLVRRLNVPWTPDYGALWEVRFGDGDVVVFSESELVTIRGDAEVAPDMAGLRSSWGEAPRRPSMPFRRLGASSLGGFAVVAVLLLAVAGVLLVWAGLAAGNVWLGVAGAVVVVVGIVSALVSIT